MPDAATGEHAYSGATFSELQKLSHAMPSHVMTGMQAHPHESAIDGVLIQDRSACLWHKVDPRKCMHAGVLGAC